MSYAADPGKVFESDAHRRVTGHLPLPQDDEVSIEDLYRSMYPDPHTPVASLEELDTVIGELVESGHATKTDAGVRMTEGALADLTGPNNEPDVGETPVKDPPPPKKPAMLGPIVADGAAATEGQPTT